MQESTLRHTKRIGLLAVLMPAVATAAPRDEIIITGTHVPVPAQELGSPVTVIDKADIESRGDPLLADLLRDVPGVAVNRGGPAGFLTQVRMRGTEANHTLVLIDGVPANDPASNGEFNFAHLVTAGIERVEVLRGPAGALYGSEAMGGVINIITEGGRRGWQAHAKGEAGSRGTVYGAGGFSGGTGPITGALNASILDTKGINASRFGDERDGYENRTLSAKGGITHGPVTVDASARYVDSSSEFDRTEFTPGAPHFGRVVDTPGEWRDQEQFYGRVRANVGLLDDMWSHTIAASLSDNTSDNYQDGVFANRIESRHWEALYQTSLRLRTGGADHRITAVAEYEKERFANRPAEPIAPSAQERDNAEKSVAGEYHLSLSGRLFLTAGLRHDAHDLFKDATTYRLDAAYRVPVTRTRLHASFGTGVTNPGFFELFGFLPGSFTGNPALRPEESESFDVGIEQPVWDDRLRIGATYFKADLTDEIITAFDSETFTSTAENLNGKSDRQGVELSIRAALTDHMELRAAYTYTDSVDPSGARELRRPRHIASMNLKTAFLDDRLKIDLGADYTGKQQDTDFATGERARLDDFLLVDVNLRYALTPRVTLTGRAENLFDASYEEVLSFRSPGLAVFAGSTLAF